MTSAPSTVELLTHLRKLGIKLWAEGDQLRYTAPQGKLTPDLRDRIATRKAEILDFLKRAESAVQAPVMPLASVTASYDGSRTEVSPDSGLEFPLAAAPVQAFPLSFAQQRLWFIEQLRPTTAVYNIPTALRLKGPLDPSVLKQSLNKIVQRHAVLRTTFKTSGEAHAQRGNENLIRQVVVPTLSHPPSYRRFSA